MHINTSSVGTRVQSAVVVLAVTLGLTVAPALLSPAGASSARPAAASAECTAARTSLTQARRAQSVAKTNVVKAKKAVTKATKAKVRKAVKARKVKAAKKALTRARSAYANRSRTVEDRLATVGYACAAPTSPIRATGAGTKLSLLGLADGLAVGPIDLGQLTSILDELLPGLTGQLNPAQLTALLGGFNAGSDLDLTDALGLLGGVFSPQEILSILGGVASPAVITELLDNVLGMLSGLGGGLPVPTNLDPTGLFDLFAGIFGNLGADQLGALLAMVTSALGAGSSVFDLGQLTGLLDSLVPGISDQFSPGQLTSMLGALNGEGLSATTLAKLMGGQFTPAQLTQVIDGTAGQALLGTVVAQVMAQLATAGGGGLELPGALGAGTLANLISTVSGLITSVLGGGILPVVCGIIPLPLICS